MRNISAIRAFGNSNPKKKRYIEYVSVDRPTFSDRERARPISDNVRTPHCLAVVCLYDSYLSSLKAWWL